METELLPGAWLLPLPRFEDVRGSFVKTLVMARLSSLSLPFCLREQFVTCSRRGVLRGMHFQVPPFEHIKLVCCLSGAVYDVLLDLRPGPGYGRSVGVELLAERPAMLYLPAGIAHGFVARSDNVLMLYQTTQEHVPTHDHGVRWDSFGHDWGEAKPVMSDRDLRHPRFADFSTPFAPLGGTPS
jgi:dTDP-4-dehydrorhamnose 3,5-epimerase/CDP-3, 6-dideoxy-D-glycero-D-glycero-4-hexulose-5-epimerase